MKFIKLVLLLGMIINSQLSYSFVVIESGVFVRAFEDISTEEKGETLRVRRFYNSGKESKGMFGQRWASEFETHLKMSSSGPMRLVINGNGKEISFYNAKITEKDIQKWVDNIVKNLAKRKSIFSVSLAD